MIISRRIRGITFALTTVLGSVLLVAARAPRQNDAAHFHTRLIKSEPATNETLTVAPRSVRLWFSERVELAITTVKLTDPAGTVIPLTTLTRPDTGEVVPISTPVAGVLPAGSYTLTWSTAAKDGHPAKGSYGFVVRAAE